MKEPGKKYNDEDNMLVNDLRSIVSKARSKAFAAVNYSLVERNWRIGQRIVEEEQNGASRAKYGKACDRGRFGCSYGGIRKRILGDKHHEFQEVLPEIQRVNNSSDSV